MRSRGSSAADQPIECSSVLSRAGSAIGPLSPLCGWAIRSSCPAATVACCPPGRQEVGGHLVPPLWRMRFVG
jgi:hypothetical protein